MSKGLGKVEKALLEIATELSRKQATVYMQDISLHYRMKEFGVSTAEELRDLFKSFDQDYETYRKNDDKNFVLTCSISRAFRSLIKKGYLKKDWHKRISVSGKMPLTLKR